MPTLTLNRPRAFACIGVLAMAPMAYSQGAFPEQPIKIVVPATPADATDLVTRIVATAVGAAARWTFVVDNRPGASGIVGMDAVAKSKPDGYTLGMGQTATLAINAEMFDKLPYDAERDFVPVAMVASQPVVLVVPVQSPIGNLAAFVTAGKKRGLTMASAGAGTVGQLVGEMFARAAGFKALSVPYKGAGPALADVVGAQTDAMFSTPPSALPLIKGGRLRALAVSSARRLPALPDVPTIAESGYPTFEATEWKAIVAPAGTAPAVVARINAEVQAALARPETIAKLDADGSMAMSGTPQQADAFLKAEYPKWRASVRASGAAKAN